jgi:hypothetical protein
MIERCSFCNQPELSLRILPRRWWQSRANRACGDCFAQWLRKLHRKLRGNTYEEPY